MTVVLVRTMLWEGTPPTAPRTPQGNLRSNPDVVVRAGTRVAAATSVTVRLGNSRGPWPRVTDEHVRAEADETDPALLAIADVCVLRAPMAWPPGCLVLATIAGGRTRVEVRGSPWRLELPTSEAVGVFASFIHTWLISGRDIASLDGASCAVCGAPPRTIQVSRLTHAGPASL